jgi:hypothetical protein
MDMLLSPVVILVMVGVDGIGLINVVADGFDVAVPPNGLVAVTVKV